MTLAATATSTLGWDTVFAVSLDNINAEIAARGKSPPQLVTKQVAPQMFGMVADCGTWKVVPGGDQGQIKVEMHLTNAVGDYVHLGVPGQITCADITAVVNFFLEWLPHSGVALKADGTPLPDAEAGTTRYALGAKTTSSNPAQPVASLSKVTLNVPGSSHDAHDYFQTQILRWANENLDEFDHVFAFLDLNDQIATGDFAFCKPNRVAYAYVDQPQAQSGLLAMMCMTSADPTPTDAAVDGLALPVGCEASFLISEKRFLLDMFTPALIKMWPNMTSGDLELDSSGTSLKLVQGSVVTLPSYTDKNGDTYTPTLNDLLLNVTGSELAMRIHTDVEVSPGIHATCTSTSYYTLAMGRDATGQQIITYTETRPADVVHGDWHETWVDIATSFAAVFAFDFAVLLTVATGGAAIVLSLAIMALTAGALAVTVLQDVHSQDAPALDDLTKTLTGPLHWTDGDMVLSQVGLHGPLVLAGKFV